MLYSENHNHNPKIKQTRQFLPSPEQFDFWGYVFITYHPRYNFIFSDIRINTLSIRYPEFQQYLDNIKDSALFYPWMSKRGGNHQLQFF